MNLKDIYKICMRNAIERKATNALKLERGLLFPFETFKTSFQRALIERPINGVVLFFVIYRRDSRLHSTAAASPRVRVSPARMAPFSSG